MAGIDLETFTGSFIAPTGTIVILTDKVGIVTPWKSGGQHSSDIPRQALDPRNWRDQNKLRGFTEMHRSVGEVVSVPANQLKVLDKNSAELHQLFGGGARFRVPRKLRVSMEQGKPRRRIKISPGQIDKATLKRQIKVKRRPRR